MGLRKTTAGMQTGAPTLCCQHRRICPAEYTQKTSAVVPWIFVGGDWFRREHPAASKTTSKSPRILHLSDGLAGYRLRPQALKL